MRETSWTVANAEMGRAIVTGTQWLISMKQRSPETKGATGQCRQDANHEKLQAESVKMPRQVRNKYDVLERGKRTVASEEVEGQAG